MREAAEEKAEKDQQKLEKENAKKSKKENFIRCKESCICNEKICKAAGLKECPVCGDVMKSQCSKARCTVENIRPLMKLPWFDVEKKLTCSTAATKKKSQSKIIKECAISTDESDYCDSEKDEGEEEEEELLLSEGEEGEGEEEVTDLQQASCSKVLDEDEIEYCDVKEGMWVVVVYEEERFIGKVQHKKAGEVNVRRLEKPLGINLPVKESIMPKCIELASDHHRHKLTRIANKNENGFGCNYMFFTMHHCSFYYHTVTYLT